MRFGSGFLFAFAISVGAFAQTESALVREGGYWVQTVNGSAPVQASDRLRVFTRGSSIIQGERRGDVSYQVTKRVRARDEAQARSKLAGVDVVTTKDQGWNRLEFRIPDGVDAKLRLRVPRGLTQVAIASHSGSVEATDLDGGFQADTEGGAINVDRIAGPLKVETGGGLVRLGKLGGAVEAYTGGGSITADSIVGLARLNTGGGSITIREAKAQVHASTGGGNIRIERAASGVTVSTGGGLIDVLDSTGPVLAETGAGSITVSSARGVRCESGAGAIKLLSVSGRLRASTASGGIVAQLSGKSLEDSALSASNGDITVSIPSNVAVTVQAVSESPKLQKIVSEFSELQIRPESRGVRAEAQGSINGGGPVLRLSALNGTILLRRQN